MADNDNTVNSQVTTTSSVTKTTESVEPEKSNQALLFVRVMLLAGLIAILIYAIRGMWWQETINGVVYTWIKFQTGVWYFSLGLLIAGSALAAGCLTGFIFAIPKSMSNASTNAIKTSKGYVSNDNLVQVSDWLTKIIVGVSLTQLTNIPRYLKQMGDYIGKSIGGAETGAVAAIAIVVYFLICGFLLSYIWTRIYFGKMLEASETD